MFIMIFTIQIIFRKNKDQRLNLIQPATMQTVEFKN